MKYILYLLLAFTLFVSCKKKESTVTPPVSEIQSDWKRINSDYSMFLAANGNTVFGCDNVQPVSFYESTDAAYTWMNKRAALPANYVMSSMRLLDTDLFMSFNRVDSGAPYGVYRYQNGIWSNRNNGLNNQVKGNYQLFHGQTKLLAKFSLPSGQSSDFYYSNDKGLSWKLLPNLYNYYCIAEGNANLFAGRVYYYGGGIIKSGNEGLTWQNASGNLPDSNNVNWLKVVNNKVFANVNVVKQNSNASGLYISSDNGSSWTLYEIFRGKTVSDVVSYGTNVFVLADQIIYRSNDNGSTFTRMSTAPAELVSMTICGSNVLVSNLSTYPPNSGIYAYEIK